MDILIASAFAAAVTLILLFAVIVFELIAGRERYSLRARVPGVLMNVVGPVLSIFVMWPISKFWDAFGFAGAVRLPLWQWLEPLGTGGYLLQFAFLVLVADFLAYWRHRAEHRWFWPIHSVHHAPRELHAANNIGHPLQALYSLAFIGLPMSFIQVDGPALPFAVGAFVGMLTYYIHSPVALHFGSMRRVIVDNRFHRIHHSLEARHFDRNFGICFSIWDYAFGTAYEPRQEWPAVGLADVPAPVSVIDYLAIPFRGIRISTAPQSEPKLPTRCSD